MTHKLLTIVFVLLFSCAEAQYDSIAYDSGHRTYLLHLPDSFSSDSIYPLVIAMHGGFGSGPQMETSTELSLKADEENFIVVYPEGSEGFLGIRTWNAGGCCGYSVNNDIDDVGFIDALIDSLDAEYNINLERVYATGMSNGGMMAYRLACELSDRIAAIAPVASTMTYAECTMEYEVPVIHFHSYLDSNVPIEGGVGDGFSDHYNPPLDSVLDAWSEFSNCQVSRDTLFDTEYFRRIQWGNCNCEYRFELYVTHDGGHSWPGGPVGIIGDPPSEYISANTLMWEFFEQYSLDCNEILSSRQTPEEEKEIKIYPNPSGGNVILVGNRMERVTVYDLQGKIYLSLDLPYSDIFNFDLSGQSGGYYFVRVTFDGGREEMIRFLLQSP